jgi:hypothetical protein
VRSSAWPAPPTLPPREPERQPGERPQSARRSDQLQCQTTDDLPLRATLRPPVKKSRLFDKSSSFTDPREPAPAPLSPRSRRRLAVLSYQKLQGAADLAPSVSSASLHVKERDSSDTWVDLMGASAPCVAPLFRAPQQRRGSCAS